MRRTRSPEAPFIIAVACQAGGTGKTTAAVGLAREASRNGLSNTLLFSHHGVVGMRMVDKRGPHPALPGSRFLAGRPGDAAAHLAEDDRGWGVLDEAFDRHRLSNGQQRDLGGMGHTLRRLRAEIAERQSEIVVIDAHSGMYGADLALALVADCLLLSAEQRDEHRSVSGAIATANEVRTWLRSFEESQGPRWLRHEMILQLPMRAGQFSDEMMSALEYCGILDRLVRVEQACGVPVDEPVFDEPPTQRSTRTWIPEQARGYQWSLDDPAVQFAYDRCLAEVLVRGERSDLAQRIERAPDRGHSGPPAAPARDEVRRAVNVRLPSSQIERWHAPARSVGAQKQEFLSALLWESLELSDDEAFDLFLRYRRAQTRRARGFE